MAFCVYSGKGISQLRNFLTELFDSMNETNGTDDTEYEDDEYENFNEDGTPEPDIEEGDGDQAPNMPDPIPANITAQRGARPVPSQPQAHEFVFNRDRPPRTVTIPTSTIGAGRQGNNVPPSVNILGATSRLNAQIQDGIAIPVAGPSRRGRHNVERTQTITDMLPIIETPSGSTSGPLNPQGQGIPTPNLHFAEIGRQQAASQPIQVPNLRQHDEMIMETPVGSYVNTMDIDQWSVIEAGSSYAALAGPSGTGDGPGNQWNMRRTLRDVFHFGRNSQESPQHYQPPPPYEGAQGRQ